MVEAVDTYRWDTLYRHWQSDLTGNKDAQKVLDAISSSSRKITRLFEEGGVVTTKKGILSYGLSDSGITGALDVIEQEGIIFGNKSFLEEKGVKMRMVEDPGVTIFWLLTQGLNQRLRMQREGISTRVFLSPSTPHSVFAMNRLMSPGYYPLIKLVSRELSGYSFSHAILSIDIVRATIYELALKNL